MRRGEGAGLARTFATALVPAVAGTVALQIRLARRRYRRAMVSAGSIDRTLLPEDRVFWDGRPLEMVALGDSGMAGVGVSRPDDSLPALIASRVAAETGRPVHVVSLGRSGARTRDVLREQVPLVTGRPDVVVLLIGTNDVTHLSRQGTLSEDTERLLGHLNGLGVPVVMSSLPEFRAMRAIPPLVRAGLVVKARDVTRVQLRAADHARNVRLVDVRQMVGREFVADLSNMSTDLFHPSAAGYGRIADALAPAVTEALLPEAWQTTAARPRPGQVATLEGVA